MSREDWREKKRREAQEERDADGRLLRNILIGVFIFVIIIGGVLGYLDR